MAMTLREWRKEKAWSQAELAEALKSVLNGKWRQSHVAAWESGTIPGGLPMAAITKLTKGKVKAESFERAEKKRAAEAASSPLTAAAASRPGSPPPAGPSMPR